MTKPNLQDEAFVLAKQTQAALERSWREAAGVLRGVPGVGSGLNGLTPDDVKATASYRAAKRRYDDTFMALRTFNVNFVKQFKHELRAERRNKGYG